jgi:hypothetical protein
LTKTKGGDAGDDDGKEWRRQAKKDPDERASRPAPGVANSSELCLKAVGWPIGAWEREREGARGRRLEAAGAEWRRRGGEGWRGLPPLSSSCCIS